MELPVNLFETNDNLLKVSIANNFMVCLPQKIFSQYNKLELFDISRNNITEWSCIEDAIQNVTSLQIVNVTGNQLRDVTRMPVLPKLLQFYASENRITELKSNTFTNVPMLQILDLSGNHMHYIHTESFNGLTHLVELTMKNNHIKQLSNETFAPLLGLKSLYFDANGLTEIPPSFMYLLNLEYLHLSNNHIDIVNTGIFEYMPSLYLLDLSFNYIRNVPPFCFRPLTSLHTLDLSSNKIEMLHTYSFINMKYLNISFNILSEFPDFTFPYFLERLDLSNNRITYVGFNMLPHSLEVVDLSWNNIKDMSSSAYFLHSSLLSIVNLSHNNMSTFSPDINVYGKYKPTFIVSGNNFDCNCMNYNTFVLNNKAAIFQGFDDKICWLKLQSVRNCGTTYPKYYCNTYSCRCCFDVICHCSYQTPLNCKYIIGHIFLPYLSDHNEKSKCNDLNINNVLTTSLLDCKFANLTLIPNNCAILPQLQYLSLDGNNFSVISAGLFNCSSSCLKGLSLNNSNITTLNPFSFQGLMQIQNLYLQDNHIQSLTNLTFEGIPIVSRLNLSNNKITYIEGGTFSVLLHLAELYLDNNMLITVSFTTLFPSTVQHMTLALNRWTCLCDFAAGFRHWMIRNAERIMDMAKMKCYLEEVTNNKEPSTYVGTYSLNNDDFKLCFNHTDFIFDKPKSILKAGLILMIVFFIVFTILTIMGYGCKNRIEWYAYMYCPGWKKVKDADNTIYDAFMSYNTDCYEDRQLIQILRMDLEMGQPNYKLCIKDRDWVVGANIAESIVESVNNSRKTIIALTETYCNNKWCLHELRTAHHRSVKKRQSQVIVILFDKNIPKNLDKILKLYIRTNTYIKWNSHMYKIQIRKAMANKLPGHRQSEDEYGLPHCLLDNEELGRPLVQAFEIDGME